MSEGIRTAAVIGSGVMGSAIAAQLAGAGIKTHLLDLLPRDLDSKSTGNAAVRSSVASAALGRALKMKPAPFYLPEIASLIEVGNLEDDLGRLRECDIVIEAIVEDLAIKGKLFARIAPFLKETALLASNTSGLSIANMSETLPESLRSRFGVLHFFNPVRYMRLVEVAGGPHTSDETLRALSRLGEFLGKGIVRAKDTTNFIANRIGVHSMMHTLRCWEESGLGVEAIDTIAGAAMARSSGATFKTADIVGLDVLSHVATNCYDTLLEDEDREMFKVPAVIQTMIAAGRLGRKSGAGFYKKEGKEILVYDPKAQDYRPKEKVRFDSVGAGRKLDDPKERLAALISGRDEAAQFAWKLLSHNLCYTARHLEEIADDLVSVDRALRWGFNWELGPFEAWDAIGVASSVERMEADGLNVPEWVKSGVAKPGGSFYSGTPAERSYHDLESGQSRSIPVDPRHLTLAAFKSDAKKVVKENFGVSLVDLGDGALCFEVHTKMNTLDADVIGMLSEAVVEAEKNFEALVIGNDGQHFGAGANLFMIFGAAKQKKWDQVGGMIRGLQAGLQGLRHCNVPVVAAPFQFTLGGGAELAMAADACQAHAETYMGLVELGVGLIPAGGGCLRMVERFTEADQAVPGVDLLPLIGQASMTVALAQVSTSAEEARQLRFLRATDGITLDRAELLQHAKQRALGMARAGYRPPRERKLRAAGADAAATIKARIWGMVEGKWASEFDGLLAGKLADTLCGGNVAAGTSLAEQDYLDLELESFLSLCGEEKTQARIEHMLKNNKPLRN